MCLGAAGGRVGGMSNSRWLDRRRLEKQLTSELGFCGNKNFKGRMRNRKSRPRH